MEVDINLLPRKKKSINTERRLYLLLFALFFFGSIGITTTKYIALKEISKLEKEAEHINGQIIEIERELEGASFAYQENGIRSEIHEIISNRIMTSEVIDRLLRQLPDTAAMLNIAYKDDGTVTVLAQFKQMADVAEYQNQLLKTAGIQQVILVKLTRSEGQNKAEQDTKIQTTFFADLSIRYDRGRLSDGGGLK